MRADAQAGMPTPDIAVKWGKNITTARKWTRGFHKKEQPEPTQPAPVAQPAQAASSPLPIYVVQPPAVPDTTVQKLQERSSLSPGTDLLRDQVLSMRSELELHQMRQQLSALAQPTQPGMDVAGLLHAVAELRTQENVGVQPLAQENRQLYNAIGELKQEVVATRSEAALKDLEGRLSGQIGVLASRLEHHSERLEELRFWAGMAERAPDIVGNVVDKTEGRILERLSHVASAGGMKIGGLWGDPRDVKPINFPKKVLAIDAQRRQRAQEVMPLPEQELEAMQRRLESEVQEEQEPRRRDLDRERRLAEEVLRLRGQVAELQEFHQKGTVATPPANIVRKVAVAGPKQEGMT